MNKFVKFVLRTFVKGAAGRHLALVRIYRLNTYKHSIYIATDRYSSNDLVFCGYEVTKYEFNEFVPVERRL